MKGTTVAEVRAARARLRASKTPGEPSAVELVLRRHGYDPKAVRNSVDLSGRPPPRARRIENAAREALDAYQSRFASSYPVDQRALVDVNMTGPIDDEMIALRRALAPPSKKKASGLNSGDLMAAMLRDRAGS